MKSEYTPDDLLPLSGIQHFLFCRRRWALIHIEQQWKDNALTTEGRIMHQRADDPFFVEKRKGVITARSVPIASYRLGLSGVCDVVEFTASPDGVKLPNRDGLYLAAPVEYKHGKPMENPADRAQLCAQALCLEEMLSLTIPKGYLYYGEIRHRVEIELTAELRRLVKEMSDEMHNYFSRGYTPKVKTSKACRSCSLADICLPKLQEKVMPASKYIKQMIET
ncbi:MAG: CRISPR-associated protein Cas4 [Chloroflexota bacterium]|nr:MAG: CRISPR-associated protein Cas4 [Anaerolineales bacterium]GIK09690.1 MAG: CRISPR-associated protein Cas4 [Chloroflexota bacterium]